MDPLLQSPILYLDTPDNPAPIAYAEQGQGDLLIFVHGSLCDLRYWRWQLTKLAPFFHTISFSLPGYWPTNPSLSAYQFNIQQHVSTLNALIQCKAQAGQRVFVVGHSRGALVAIRFAIQHPFHLHGLALADPAFMLDQSPQPLAVLSQAADLLARNNDEAALALFIDAVSGENTWRHMVGWFKTMVEDNAHTLLAQSRERLPTVQRSELTMLQHLNLLLISGELSPERYQLSTSSLKEALPAFKHGVISRASHGMNLANPKAFNELLRHTFMS